LEIREAGVVVVVSIPERLARSNGATGASDLRPHGLRGVDTDGVRAGSLDELLDELAVVLGVGGPAAVGAGVGLNVEPDGAPVHALALKEVDHGGDLVGSGLSSAGEEIDVDDGDASGLGGVDGARSIVVRPSE